MPPLPCCVLPFVSVLAASFALAACSTGSASPAGPSTGASSTANLAGASGAGNPPSGGAAGSAGAVTTAGGQSSPSHGGAPAGTGGSSENAGGAGGAPATGATDFCSARPGLSFCETFEDQPLGVAQSSDSWTTSINGDGTLEIDGNEAHAGAHSLKVRGSGFSTFLVLSDEALLTAPSPLHVRAYVRLAEAMTAGHNTFIIADSAAMPGTGNAFRLGEMNQMLMYTVSGDTHGALANENFYTDQRPGAALEGGKWSCLEFVLDPSLQSIAVSLDGSDIPDLHHTDFPLDHYDALRFGFEKYAGPVSDVWYDDIAIGSEPIGCR